MESPEILVKELILIGGGHAHVHTIKMLGMKAERGVAVTLISRDVDSPYSGMIPGFVAGHYTREECHVDLAKLCSFAGVNMVNAEACKLDTNKRLIYCKDGRPPIYYDVLSIDVGIAPKPLPQIFKENRFNITPVKPIDGFASRWDIILARVLAVTEESSMRIALVGGGAGGVELGFAMHHRLHKEMEALGKDSSNLQITIYNRGKNLMSSHSRQVQSIISRIAFERGIEVELNADIVHVDTIEDEEVLVAKDGRTFCFDEAVWCTEAVAQSWVKESGLLTTEDGFICVTPNLESSNTPGVFACGDVAHLTDNPRPKAGVFAVRAGPPLTLNLRNKLSGKPLVPWMPQEQFLGIISTGNAYAIASKGPIGIEGSFLWDLKDKIDRDWMRGYSEFPDKEEMMRDMKRKKKILENKPSSALQTFLEMLRNDHNISEDKKKIVRGFLESATNEGARLDSNGKKDEEKEVEKEGEEREDEEGVSDVARSMGKDTIDMLSSAKMRCGGCGSKVGAQVLSRALSKVRKYLHTRPEVIAGIGGKTGDDAALLLPPLPPHFMVQTIDYFRSFVSDPYLFGQIAANHALSDIYAMNGEPVSALALVVIPYGPEDKVENMLVQMLAGCLYVLKRETCALVGGHTAEGTECSMGLAVSGVAHPDRVFHKGLTGKDMKKITLLSDHDNENSNNNSNSSNNNDNSDSNSDNSDSNGSIRDPQRGISKIETPLGSSSSSVNAVSCNGHLGHVLVLTKALGTGTIMAAHMRAKAKGSWVKNAYDSMLQSNREAAHILGTYGCSACTDITGFGLMGHLLEMIKFDDDQNQTSDEDAENEYSNGEVVGVDKTESENIFKAVITDDTATGEIEINNDASIKKTETVQIAVELSIKAVPVLLGATECINDGIFSSLQPQNIRCARAVGNIHLGKLNTSYPLLYDPQTSGGLLAAVPAECVEKLLISLHSAGYTSASAIGTVIRREEHDILVVLAE